MQEFPVLSSANAVLFPKTYLPIQISRISEIKTILRAAENNRQIGIISQTRGANLQVGCMGYIEMFEKAELNRYNVLVRGSKRFSITRSRKHADYFITFIKERPFRFTAAERSRLYRWLYESFELYLEKVVHRHASDVFPVRKSNDLEELTNVAAAQLDLEMVDEFFADLFVEVLDEVALLLPVGVAVIVG